MENTLSGSIYKHLGNKKIVAIAVFYTILLVASLISLVQGSDDGILGIIMQLNEWGDLGIEDILEAFRTVIIVIGVIQLIPDILATVAFWLCASSGKKQKSSAGRTGLTILAIPLLWHTIKTGVSIILIIVALGMIFSAGFSSLVLVLGLLVLAVLALIFSYYLKFTKLLFGISRALKTGKGNIYVYKMVTAFLLIVGIFRFIGAFFSIFSFSIFGIFQKVAAALTSVFLFSLFKSFRTDCEKGFATESEAPITAAQASVASAIENVVVQKQSQAQVAPVEAKVVSIFSSNIKEFDNRFECLAEKEYQDAEAKIIALSEACLLKDALSEKVVLRLLLNNVSGRTLEEVSISIKSYNNVYKQIGQVANIKLDKTTSEAFDFAEFGITLSNDVKACEIKIDKVVFDDQLSWDKGSEIYTLLTKEKLEFDKEVYISMFNK